MIIKQFSKQDTNIFKAIGILLIVFHNYLHLTKPYTGENEFTYSSDTIKNLYNGIIETPLELINLLFSYFGHYGVQIFIFMSGLGLTLSMMSKSQKYWQYFLNRMKKYYPMLIVALSFFFFLTIITAWRLMTIAEWRSMLWKFLNIHTLLPDQYLSINGPWWFLGLIFQFYIIFPLLFVIIKRFNLKGFIVICLLSFTATILEAYSFHLPENIFWMANSIAHLPEFTFGILIALNKDKKIHFSIFISALVIFILGNYFKVFYFFSFLSITVLSYGIISFINEKIINRTNYTKKVLLNIGKLSMSIFIVHGMFRHFFLAIFSNSWWEKLIGAGLFFIAIYGLSLIAENYYKWLYNSIETISSKICSRFKKSN